MQIVLSRLVIYSKRISEMITFYREHFGFEVVERAGDRIVELRPAAGGCSLLLHPASKGQKEGQTAIKLVFDVRDVAEFCRSSATRGLVFGPIHEADGYSFANAKDPSNNSISVSSRAFSSNS